MNSIARVVHHLSGRTRVKVPAKRGQAEYFERVSQHLSGCPGVIRVETNCLTGSVLLRHTVPFAQIAAFAGRHKLFTLPARKPASNTMLQQASQNFAQAEAELVDLSEGGFDLRSLVLVALLVMSLIQLARGEVLAPATTLLWYALELLLRK